MFIFHVQQFSYHKCIQGKNLCSPCRTHFPLISLHFTFYHHPSSPHPLRHSTSYTYPNTYIFTYICIKKGQHFACPCHESIKSRVAEVQSLYGQEISPVHTEWVTEPLWTFGEENKFYTSRDSNS